MRSILTTVGTSLLTNAKRHLNRSDIHDQHLTAYLTATPAEQASAETNSLSRLLQEEDRVILLYSDTPEGKQCALALQRLYTSQGYSADVVVVAHLTYTEQRFKMRGLRSLVATLIDLIRRERRQGREVCINATGGFKAEIAYTISVRIQIWL